MNILFPTDARTVHGIETILLDLVRQLASHGHTPLVLVAAGDKFARRVQQLGVQVRLFHEYSDPRAAVWLRDIIQAEVIDVVHLFYSSTLLAAVTAARLARRPAIYHFENFPPEQRRTWVPRALRLREYRIGLRGTAATVACNEEVRNAWLREGVIRLKRSHVIHNGVDIQRFSSSARTPGTRSVIGIPDDAEIIGFAGQLVDYKGIQEFFQAGAHLSQSRPNLYLLIVGGLGPPEYYESALLGTVRRLHIEQRTIFAGYQDDVPRYLAEMDVLLVPSWREPFGMVVLEGMATGVPVIGTSAGGIPEIIRGGEDGLLVPPRDVAALAAATADLLNHPEKRASLRCAGLARVREQFTTEHAAARLTVLYEQLRLFGGRRGTIATAPRSDV
ncbi:MAG: glycosyltransferase family 4 protein [Chloroflexi bacterium]|nr:glycosyltransferase family 4 protein [Chloroflexota bacterium]